MDERLDRAPIGALVVTPDGTVAEANDAARSMLSVGAGEIEDTDIGTVFPHSVERRVPGAFADGAPDERRSFDEYYPELDRWLSVTLVPSGGDVTVYLRDVTEREQAARSAADLRDELDRMAITDGLVSEILSALVDASTREEIAETICTRLGRTDIYEFAWVGERELGDDDVVVRASAGATERMLGPIEETLAAAETGPEERAVETGELQVVQPLADASSVPDSIRQAAFAGGLQSMLAIPLTYGSSDYGVVGVYATGQEAFSERERESFRTVGEMAGLAVNAARHRTLLLSDSVIELTIEVTADNGPLAAATATLDASVAIDGLVPRRDEVIVCYVVVDGADPERAADVLGDAAAVERTRVVDREETAGVLEAAVRDDTPLGFLLGQGGTIESAEYDGGRGRITCEFPPDEDVRRVADAAARRFDGEVLAKRQVERDATTPTEFRDELRDRLTDRQETALRTAFFADYFESPRESSAEEVAEALDITGPTLLYHLRAGQRKLLDTFFDSRARD